jgi:hypothetical protein
MICSFENCLEHRRWFKPVDSKKMSVSSTILKHLMKQYYIFFLNVYKRLEMEGLQSHIAVDAKVMTAADGCLQDVSVAFTGWPVHFAFVSQGLDSGVETFLKQLHRSLPAPPVQL